jgi:hypothetical protein
MVHPDQLGMQGWGAWSGGRLCPWPRCTTRSRYWDQYADAHDEAPDHGLGDPETLEAWRVRTSAICWSLSSEGGMPISQGWTRIHLPRRL